MSSSPRSKSKSAAAVRGAFLHKSHGTPVIIMLFTLLTTVEGLNQKQVSHSSTIRQVYLSNCLAGMHFCSRSMKVLDFAASSPMATRPRLLTNSATAAISSREM